MEEQTRLIASRRGYKGHVTRLFTKIDELIDREFDDYTITSLNNSIEQLTRKMEKLTHIDEQLLKLYDDASELETAVMEAEELHDDIMDKVVRAWRYIELNTTRQSGRVSPTPASQVQSNGGQTQSTSNVAQASDILLSTTSITSEATSHVPTAATSHVPTAATSDVSIVVTSEISTPATSHLSMANSHVSTATTYHFPTDEYNVEVTSTQGATMPPPRMTSLLYSDGSRPPPLIPATFYIAATPSSISPYRPFMSTAFAPGNLYELPLSTQAHRFPASVITTHVASPIQDHHQFSNTRLPKLTLPTFSGDPLNWLTFWDSFYMTIHANPT